MAYGVRGDISYGWVCATCGAWVPSDVTHVCPGELSGTAVVTEVAEHDLKGRRVKALERIANSLEKIANKR